MVLIVILTLILFLLFIAFVATTSVIGAGAIIIFADVIVCGLFIGWLIKKLIKK